MNNWIQYQSHQVTNLVQTAEERARAIPLIGILLQAARAYGEDCCSQLAAALSYYALLSIFPLMLFLFAVASFFIPTDRVVRTLAGFFTANLPLSTTLLYSNLQEVTRLRGAITIVTAAGFIWSASSVFNVIQIGINRAFRVQRDRPMWRQQLVSFGMVFIISLIFGLSLLVTTWIRLAIHYRVLQRNTLFTDALPIIGTILLSTTVFGLLYRYVPYDPVIRWRMVWLAALIAAALWEIAKLVFAWYLTSYALLNMVYGSAGAVIAIMLWGYVTAAILLFCAEFAAIQAGTRQRARTGDEWWSIVERRRQKEEG
jgi:membrane protein